MRHLTNTRPLISPITVVGSNYTVKSTDSTIKALSSSIVITLHTAVGFDGMLHDIKNSSSQTITVSSYTNQTIDDLNVQSVPSKSNLKIQSDGTNWIIL